MTSMTATGARMAAQRRRMAALGGAAPGGRPHLCPTLKGAMMTSAPTTDLDKGVTSPVQALRVGLPQTLTGLTFGRVQSRQALAGIPHGAGCWHAGKQ